MMANQLSDFEKILQTVFNISKIIWQFILASGVLIVAIYLMNIHYYPRGITIGDSFFFLVVVLSFGFLYSLVFFVIFSVVILLTPLWKIFAKIMNLIHQLFKNDREVQNFHVPSLNFDHFSFFVVGIIGIFITTILYSANRNIFWGIITSIFLIGFSYILLSSIKIDNKEEEKRRKIILSVIMYFIPLMVGNFQGNILNKSMELIGIRIENAIIELNEDYSAFLEKITGNEKRKLYNVTILFNGLGSYSLIKYQNHCFIIPNEKYRVVYYVKNSN